MLPVLRTRFCCSCVPRARLTFMSHSSASQAQGNRCEDKLKIEAEPPPSGTNNWVGPPDPVSNIRPIRLQVPTDETDTERHFRQWQNETIEWNHNFWKKHNFLFFKEKEEFVEKIKQATGEKASAEELSQFYKKFLDDNRVAHLQYNRDWYKKNLSLLWPALQVAVIKAIRRSKQGRK